MAQLRTSLDHTTVPDFCSCRRIVKPQFPKIITDELKASEVQVCQEILTEIIKQQDTLDASDIHPVLDGDVMAQEGGNFRQGTEELFRDSMTSEQVQLAEFLKSMNAGQGFIG